MQINKRFPAKILAAAEGHGPAAARGGIAWRGLSRFLIGGGTIGADDVGICGAPPIASTFAKFPI